MNYFIACDVAPEDFGSIVRCADFNGGNPQVLTEAQVIAIYSSDSSDTDSTTGTTVINNSIPLLTQDDYIQLSGFALLAFITAFGVSSIVSIIQKK